MNLTKWRGAALTLAAIFIPSAASAQIVDFAQFDISKDTRTLAIVKALKDQNPQPDPLLSANYTRWTTGTSSSLGYMHRWALTSGGQHNWAVGAGVGLNRFEGRSGRDDESGLSLRGQTELSGPAPGGSYFALLQLSTFRSSSFALAQYNIRDSRLGFDVSRYQEKDVKQWTMAVRVALDDRRRWFFRAGVVDSKTDLQPFVGLAFNAF